MTEKIDIYRAAKLYLDQHGDQAALQAAMQADEQLGAGDMDGAATWRKIINAIEVMQATEPVGQCTDYVLQADVRLTPDFVRFTFESGRRSIAVLLVSGRSKRYRHRTVPQVACALPGCRTLGG
ncbi:MAG: hypothetical protein O7B98_03825 [Alphaproteobacteria bacterium]|nr:hypothetical protein [Alphaproteobacteria bacterium]